MAEENKPEKRFKSKGVTASIFPREIEGKNGRTVIKNTVIQRTYKDQNGNWKYTDSFGINDLPKVEAVARKAYEYLTTEEESN